MATKKTTTSKVKAVKKKVVEKRNVKLESAELRVIAAIKRQLYGILGTRAYSMQEVRHYKKDYPAEIDYRIAQDGNLLVYIEDIRRLYKKLGYSERTISKLTDVEVWEMYLRHVGAAVRTVLEKK